MLVLPCKAHPQAIAPNSFTGPSRVDIVGNVWMNALLDRIAAQLGMWALRRLFGADCPDHDDNCASCQAARLIELMGELR